MDHASFSVPEENSRWFGALANTGPLAAILMADALLEQTWATAVPESVLAAPLCIVIACALALAKCSAIDGAAGADALRSVLQRFRPDLGARTAIRTALAELRRLAGAREAMIALDGRSSLPLLLADDTGVDNSPVRTLSNDERSTYFSDWPLPPRSCEAPSIAAFEIPCDSAPVSFQTAHSCDSVVGVAFRCGDDCDGRLFLLDVAEQTRRETFLREFERVLGQLVPALTRICELHALRHRAAAQERARIGRELHDGVVQGLAGLDMELELIRLGDDSATSLRQRLVGVQDRLRTEISNLRALLQRARSHDIDSARLPAVLEELVERFGRDTRVDADYVSEVSEVRLPPQVCGEIARIVQEALVNVRRHSGARHVVVKFSCDRADWKLTIQDDGRGFTAPPRQRLWGAAARTVRPPSVIQERVQSIGGTVRVVAADPSGARLEITARRHPWNPTA